MEKGTYLTILDHEHESHVYNNQENIQEEIGSLNNSNFR